MNAKKLCHRRWHPFWLLFSTGRGVLHRGALLLKSSRKCSEILRGFRLDFLIRKSPNIAEPKTPKPRKVSKMSRERSLRPPTLDPPNQENIWFELFLDFSNFFELFGKPGLGIPNFSRDTSFKLFAASGCWPHQMVGEIATQSAIFIYDDLVARCGAFPHFLGSKTDGSKWLKFVQQWSLFIPREGANSQVARELGYKPDVGLWSIVEMACFLFQIKTSNGCRHNHSCGITCLHLKCHAYLYLTTKSITYERI